MTAYNSDADVDWKRMNFGHDACCNAIVSIVLFPTQSVDIVQFIVQWIEWCISGVVTLTSLTRSALFLDFITISAACTMRGINKLYLVLKGTVACSGIIGRTTIVLAWSGDWMNHESDHGSAFFLPSSGLCKGTSNSWHNCTDPILLWLRMLLWKIQPNVITWLTWV